MVFDFGGDVREWTGEEKYASVGEPMAQALMIWVHWLAKRTVQSQDQGIQVDDEAYHRHQVKHGYYGPCHCDSFRICDLSFASPECARL